MIGNGADSSNLSDAFKVMFNGDATVSNDLTVLGDLVIKGGQLTTIDLVITGGQLTIGDHVLTGDFINQLKNLLTLMATCTGDEPAQKACLKTKWNALSTC